MTQDLLRAMQGSFPEVAAKQGSRGSVARIWEMATQPQPGCRGPEGRGEAEAGRKYRPPKALSGPKGWNTVTQPWTSASRAQKARGSAPQVLSFHPREELKWESGNWEIWKPSRKGLFKLMDGTNLNLTVHLTFSLMGVPGAHKEGPIC